MSTITLLTTFAPTNVGNLFIDLGSAYTLTAASSDANIQTVSGLPRILEEFQHPKIMTLNRIFSFGLRKLLNKRKLFDIRSRIENLLSHLILPPRNYLDLALYLKSDYVVISGCVLTEFSVTHFGKTLFNLKRKGAKIIFNGVGGSSYSEFEIYTVRKFLKKIRPYAFISRDEISFENYGDLARFSFNGVDCAFFLKDFFHPVKLDLPKYIVLTFDKLPEPKIQFNGLIIRTHHKFWGKLPRRFFNKPNVLISDSPFDYLNVYANAACLLTDRVHACVAAVSYGTPCKLYYKTKRALLFDRIGLSDITKRVIHPGDYSYSLEKEKEKHLSFLSDILD